MQEEKGWAHERFLSSAGLLGSEWSPALRAFVAFSSVSVVVFLIEPEWAFDKRGCARPWKHWRNVEGRSTSFPWWLPGLAASVVAGVIV